MGKCTDNFQSYLLLCIDTLLFFLSLSHLPRLDSTVYDDKKKFHMLFFQCGDADATAALF